MTAQAIGPLLRTAIIVADLKRSLSFYTDLLGLEEVFAKGRLADPAAARLLGVSTLVPIPYAIVKAPGPALGMIGLFEIAARAPAGGNAAGREPGRGTTCLVFNHRDLDDLHERLEASGHEIICPPVTLRVAADLESVEMTFRDPDGVMINCIQRDPGGTM